MNPDYGAGPLRTSLDPPVSSAELNPASNYCFRGSLTGSQASAVERSGLGKCYVSDAG